jgi:iron(III) transport system substrate-binding protein
MSLTTEAVRGEGLVRFVRTGILALLALSTFPLICRAEGIGSICTKGEAEPTLVWYTSQDPARNDAAVAAFAQDYPRLKVEAFRLATGALAARYGTEAAAGVASASVVTIGDATFIAKGLDRGWFVKLDKSELPALDKLDARWFHDGATTTTINVLGLAYNTNRIHGPPPTTWKDLIDPKYRGELILGDPRAIPSYMSLLKVWYDVLGADFIEALHAQKPVFVPSVVPATQQLAAGEVTVVVPNTLATSDPLISQGAPVKFVVPEVTTGNEFLTVLSANGKSPNAARCLYNFLLTPEGQIAYTGSTGVSPLGSSVAGQALPPRYIDPQMADLPAQREKLLALLGLQ